MIEWIITILFAMLFADFLSGVFHWWEDRYGNPDWPLIGEWIIRPNQLHHTRPGAICQGSYWNRNSTTLVPSLVGVALFWWCLPVCLGFVLLSQSNEVHSWSHQRCNPFIRFLQRLGICQSPRHHAIHHKQPFDRYFCVMTNYLNPVLNWFMFWDYLELAIYFLTDIAPRPERQLA